MDDSWEVITFMNNTPSGIDWTRIVLTTDNEIGQLKGGSAHLLDPEKYAPPPWLTPKKATEIWKLHTGKNKEFKDKEDAKDVFWKYFRPKAVKPIYEDFSIYYLKRIGKWKEEGEDNSSPLEKPKRSLGEDMSAAAKATTRKRTTIPGDAKITTTGKQPKSEKNLARLKFYNRAKVSTVLENHPEVSMADIKYDIKNGYAEIVG